MAEQSKDILSEYTKDITPEQRAEASGESEQHDGRGTQGVPQQLRPE